MFIKLGLMRLVIGGMPCGCASVCVLFIALGLVVVCGMFGDFVGYRLRLVLLWV